MHKRLLSVLIGTAVLLSSWLGLGDIQPAKAEPFAGSQWNQVSVNAQIFRNPVEEKFRQVGRKVDLNNSSVLAFRRYRGLYPTLARKVIEHAPYDTVEAVLNIPDLSDRELEVLKANLDNFVVTAPEPALTEGGDRINPGIYK